MTRTLYDASSPPPDPHLDVCGGYIGGDTPHIWSDAEWAGQSARWRLPIYTCDNPGQRNPTTDAQFAVSWMHTHGVPAASAVALDFETAVNGSYVASFDAVVVAGGYRTLLYGSLSTVTRNPRPSAGYWTASWTGSPHLDAGAAATQYISDTQLGRGYDLSQVADGLVLWDTQAPAVEDDMFSDNDRSVLDNVSAFLFEGGTSSGMTPPGGANNGLVQKVDYLLAEVPKLQAPSVDPVALAAAVKTVLQDPAVLSAVAKAFVAELHAITSAA